MKVQRSRLLAAVGAFAALTVGGPNALAQQQELEEVTVTGSRILRRDFEANSPITTVDAEAFESTSTIGIESVMNQLPQFVPAVTQFVTSDYQAEATNTPGSATLSLRGLGSNRNLVLLDGRRAMPVNASMAVDINTIPSAAIERVETITGGASSVYGADAMAGVVNFILRDDFEGVDLDVQYGETLEGDGAESRLSGVFGMSNADDTGNVMLGFDHASRDPVREIDREFFRSGWADPTVDGTEDFYTEQGFEPSVTNPVSQATLDSIFSEAPSGSVSPFSNFYLNEDGSVYQTEAAGAYRYDGPMTRNGAARRFIGDEGDLQQNMTYRLASFPMDRYSLFGRGHFDFTDNLTVFAQGNFSQSETHTQDDYSPMLGGWRARIPGAGEALYEDSVDEGGDTLPAYQSGGRYGLNCGPTGGCTYAEVFPTPPELTQLLANREDPTAPWDMRQSSTWADAPRSTNNKVTSYQLVFGVEGALPENDWTWEFYASHGSTAVQSNMGGFVSLARWRHLVSQPNYGTGFFMTANDIGDGFSAGTARCTTGMPIVEDFEPSRDCKEAVQAPLQNTSDMVQDVAEFNIQGGLVEMPAGQLRFAAGASTRENTYAYHTDVLSSQQSFLDLAAGLFPASNSSGSTKTNELYGELLVPLLSDQPAVEDLNLELGYRSSDNDPSNDVDTHKALLDWSVNSSVRIRGGRQVANRAPNIGELFLSRTQTWATSFLGDFCSEGNPSNPNSANPALNPDHAADVRAICEARMGPAAAARYYDPANDQPDEAFAWRFANTVGNPELRSETAETATLGVVLEIGSQASLSLDWWQIEIRDMIAAQSVDSIYSTCMSPETNPTFDPNHPACQRVVRDPSDGGGTAVDVTYTNEGAVNTAGIDAQLNWGRPLASGNLDLSVRATLLEKIETRIAPTDEFTDWKGTSGPNDLSGVQGGAYDFKTYTTLTYFEGPWNLTLRWRHLPSLASAASLQDPNDTSVPTDPYNMFDVSGGFSFGENWQLRYGIDNVLDEDPELMFADDETTARGRTNASFYDVLGRRYFFGLKVQF